MGIVTIKDVKHNSFRKKLFPNYCFLSKVNLLQFPGICQNDVKMRINEISVIFLSVIHSNVFRVHRYSSKIFSHCGRWGLLRYIFDSWCVISLQFPKFWVFVNFYNSSWILIVVDLDSTYNFSGIVIATFVIPKNYNCLGIVMSTMTDIDYNSLRIVMDALTK